MSSITKLVRGLYDSFIFLCDFPILSYGLTSLIFSPSIFKAMSLFTAYIFWSCSTYYVPNKWLTIMQYWNMLLGCLSKTKDCKIQERIVEEYIGADIISRIRSFPHMGMLEKKLGNLPGMGGYLRKIRIFQLIPNNEPPVLFDKRVAYWGASAVDDSYIFVWDDPSDGTTYLTRFFLCHEIGHASLFGSQISLMSFRKVASYVCLALLLVVNSQWHTYTIIAGLLYLVILVFAIIKWIRVDRYYFRLNTELIADNFAMYCMSQEDQIQLGEYAKRRKGLPSDKSLNELVSQRNKRFLDKFVSFGDVQLMQQAISRPSAISLLLTLLAILFGYYSQSIDRNLLATNFILFVFIPLSISLVIGVYKIIWHLRIEKLLENKLELSDMFYKIPGVYRAYFSCKVSLKQPNGLP